MACEARHLPRFALYNGIMDGFNMYLLEVCTVNRFSLHSNLL